MPRTYQANTIRLITQLTFKGAPHKTSNEYAFTGVALAPADCTELATKVATDQAHLAAGTYSAHIVKAYCYSPGDTTARAQVDFTGGGATSGIACDASYWTLAVATAQQPEVATLLKAPIGVDTKGRAKFVRKFIHPAYDNGNGTGQIGSLTGAGATEMALYHTGGIGSKNWLLCSPSGVAITGPISFDRYLLTHQLREGKKPAGN